MESLAGQLLVASLQLADPNFARSLVFLIQHTKEGAFGVVVNRPTGKTLQQLWREVGSSACHSHKPVYLGGPVPGPLVALHVRPDLSEGEPAPGVFFAAQKQHLDALVLSESPDYKIFIGHAGWGANQLENEIRQGAWRVAPAAMECVFATDDAIWDRVFRRIGQSLLKSMLNLDELPPDPTLN
jgi:putative transcriptional regulator